MEKIEVRLKEFEFRGYKYSVGVVPIAATDTQFVIFDNVNEIISVGYWLGGDKIVWKYGKPADEFKDEIESIIVSLLKSW